MKQHKALTFDDVAVQQVFTTHDKRTHRYEQYRKMDNSTAIGVGRRYRGKVKIFRDNKTGAPDAVHEMGKPMFWTYAINVPKGSKTVNLTQVWDITHSPEVLHPLTPVSRLTNKRGK